MLHLAIDADECALGLLGAIDRGSPVRSGDDHRRRQNPTDIAVGDQILDVIDQRRHLVLQATALRIPSPSAALSISAAVGVAAQRPLEIDVLSDHDRGQRPAGRDRAFQLYVTRSTFEFCVSFSASENSSRTPKYPAPTSAESCRSRLVGMDVSRWTPCSLRSSLHR
jgi:hypothetical protein